jgi:hypothetical protein
LKIKPVIVVVSAFFASNIHAQDMSVIAINDSSYIVSGGVNETSVSRTIFCCCAGEYRLIELITGYIEGQLQRASNGNDDADGLQI